MWRELEAELRLKKQAEKEAEKEAAGKTEAELKHRVMLLRRRREQKHR